MSHPDEGTWNALLDGEIPSDELGPITAHLTDCAACRARLEEARALMGEADQLVAALGDPAPGRLAAPMVHPAPNRTRVYRQLAWAASVMLAATLGYSVRNPGQPAVAGEDGGSSRIQEAQEAPAPPAAVDPAPPVGVPAADLGNRPPAARAEGRPPTTAPASPPRSAPTETEATSRRQEAPAQLSGSSAAVAPPAAKALGSVQRLNDARARGLAPEQRTLGAAPSPALQLAERADAIVESFVPIEFAAAVTLLGGSLRLVDGLVPDRLEASGSAVRVIYPLQVGELVLEQRRMGDSIRVSLRGPISADSLAVLLGRVR